MPPESPSTIDISDTSAPAQENISPAVGGITDANNSLPETLSVPEFVDERFETFTHDDPVYQDMMRTVDREQIRLRLSVRYTLLMFGIFLAFAWIVNNRIIMFEFSEFVWLARIRDGLFGVMAGLFSLTLWHGSPVWFQNNTITSLLRVFSLLFFGGVIIALYFPII